MTTRRSTITTLLLALSFAAPAAGQQNFQLYGAPSDLYASGVKVQAGRPVYFSSGVLSNVKDGGSMAAQALAAMKRLEANIAAAGFTLADVAFVRAYLKPGADGVVDYAGWDKAWGEVFSAKTGVKPARSTVAMPLNNPNSGLIELEYVCASGSAAKMVAAAEAAALPAPNPNVKPLGTKEGRILAGAGVMPGAGYYWTAGLTAPVLNREAPASSYESRGDMYTQAKNTLTALKNNIASVGLTLSDVVYVRAFVGPDFNKGGVFDTEAWNKAYGEFFNNPEQPHKPARVTMTTPSYASNAGGKPNTMIEIEFVAAFPSPPPLFEGVPATSAVRGYGAPTAMFASGVAVKPGSSLYFSSSVMAASGGDMKAQAASALESLKTDLTKAGAKLSDVVFLRAYLVPAADGSIDRDGWNQAYGMYFNNPGQPQKPARVTMGVTSLPKPGATIAIDVVAALP